MCGHDWCSVRISKEIQAFASGKADEFAWDKPKVSAALTPDQQAILEKRGVLPPEEIHRLAGKTRKAVGAEAAKAACHSDLAAAGDAQQLQQEKLVQIGA